MFPCNKIPILSPRGNHFDLTDYFYFPGYLKQATPSSFFYLSSVYYYQMLNTTVLFIYKQYILLITITSLNVSFSIKNHMARKKMPFPDVIPHLVSMTLVHLPLDQIVLECLSLKIGFNFRVTNFHLIDFSKFECHLIIL